MKIFGVNGIGNHGEGNIDLLVGELAARGLRAVDLWLPRRNFITAKWGGRPDGLYIAANTQDGDILVAHSFGCLRAWYAHQCRTYKAIFCIAPAMSRGYKWAEPHKVHCWYSPDDWAVRIGSWLGNHPFGRAGTRGFKQFGIRHHIMPGSDHDDFFHGENRTQIANQIEYLARS